MPPTPPSAPTQADLYAVGRGWLPKVLFAKAGVREAVNQAAAVWARIGQRLDELYQGGLIQLSTGVYLRQHLRDVGSAPSSGEAVAVARLRARTVQDQATPAALLKIANDLLTAAGGAGGASLLELRQGKAWCEGDFAGAATSYCDHGYRAGPDRHPSWVIVVLPYGTTTATADAIAAALYQRRSAGYPVMIEVRANP